MPQLQLIETRPADTAPHLSDDEVQAMQRAFVKLGALWGITDDQAAILMGDVSVRTYRRWKAGDAGRIDRDLGARLSNLMGIHQTLRVMFREAERGYRWIKAPNAAFDGASALAVMLGGDLTDLMRVRRYLDAARGGW